MSLPYGEDVGTNAILKKARQLPTRFGSRTGDREDGGGLGMYVSDVTSRDMGALGIGNTLV